MNHNQSNHRPTVLISGGGVAGPALALFLKKAGIESTIYEAGSEPTIFEVGSHAGAFLNVASNGMSVLETLGLADVVAAEGIACPRIMMWNGKGKKLGEVANGLPPGTGQPSVTIKRSVLHTILRQEAERQGIAMHFGKRLQGVTVQDGWGEHGEAGKHAVHATFEDGSHAEGDLLIGCDGVHSATRRIIDPSAPAPKYTGLISCGAYARLPESSASLLDGVPRSTQHLVFGKRAFFGYLVKPDGEIYWFENLGYSGTPRRSELEAIPDEEWKARLLALHSDDMPLVNEIIRATQHKLGMYPIYDIPTQPIWHKGPIALIGDAAHATSPSAGQGASLALEDAIVLAKCLRDLPKYTPQQVEAAFSTFEQLRRERAEKVVKSSRQLGANKVAPNAFVAWMRDLTMPFFLRHFTNDDALRWLVGYQVAWE